MITPLTPAQEASIQATGVWSPDCPVPLQRLRQVKVTHWDMTGATLQEGTIIVLDVLAQATQRIFNELLDRRFPIHSVRPMDQFNADDDAAVAANNTSAHCHRTIANTTVPSIHSYGAAIDLNPRLNPYIAPQRCPGGEVTLADHKIDYLNRHVVRPGMVEPVVDVFYKNGFFIWGGHWVDPLDLHHFQTTRAMARIMTTLEPAKAQIFFEACIAFPRTACTLVWAAGQAPDAAVARILAQADQVSCFQDFLQEFFVAACGELAK